jgi:hypothetical protein
MQLYSHFLDLRIWHPNLDPDAVSSTLGIQPDVAWRKGEPRKTRKGTLLQGVYSDGYWSANPFDYGWRPSTDMQLEDAIEELVSYLEPHREFLFALSQEGVVRIWASTQSTRNYAVELPPRTLNRMSALGATFVHDVYQGAG